MLIGGFIALVAAARSGVLCDAALYAERAGDGNEFSVLVRQMVDGVNFSPLSIPFFILMGEIMGAGAAFPIRSSDLVNLAVGRFRGGLAVCEPPELRCSGGISGSAVADVSSFGSVVIPMMKQQGTTILRLAGPDHRPPGRTHSAEPQHGLVYALAVGGGVSTCSHGGRGAGESAAGDEGVLL